MWRRRVLGARTLLLWTCLAGGAAGQTRTFTNPLKAGGPDPWVVAHDGFFFYMNTTGKNLTIWKLTRMEDLGKTEGKVVWTPPPGTPYSRELWAPELHWLDGRWYLYFAADAGSNAGHRIYVIENPSPDPTVGDWSFKGKITDDTDRWAIDATILEPSRETKNRMYMIWSGWEGDRDGTQSLYIARMKNPWTIEGKRTRISTPQFPWEKVGDLQATADGRTVREMPHVDVNEGPEVLLHGGEVFVVYSASACWTNYYALGMLSASVSSNLLKGKSWAKSSTPVFWQNPEGGAFGTGHNSFFRSPDGTEDWILYHANSAPNQGCGDLRSPRMQRFSWKADGTPDFGRPVPLRQPLTPPSGER